MSAEMIRVAAVVLRDADGRVLTVRKRGTDRFMLPGGKPEPGEAPLQTARREAAEEVGLQLDPQRLSWLGEFTARAANEAGREVTGAIFETLQPITGEALGALRPAAEIEAMRWSWPQQLIAGDEVAPLLGTQVIPALFSRNSPRMAQNGQYASSDPTSPTS